VAFSVLLAGVSTRAAAESAARAGFAVTTVDAFADLDQHPAVRAVKIQPFSPGAAARAATPTSSDAVAYLSNFENFPRAVAALSSGAALWGNAPPILRRVRNPAFLAEALGRLGIAAPVVWRQGDPPDDSVRWLVKPVASGGGHGVGLWDGGWPVPRRSYLQEFIDGTPGSIVFVAAGRRAVPLGISRQLIGEPAFGSLGYRYCGSMLVPAGDPQFLEDERLAKRACELARAVVEEFDLVGVNGIDFIARDAVPYAVEVNPRWSASMEVVERAYGVSVFGAHAAACRAGSLPDFDLASARRGARAFGKAIVFANRDLVVGDTRAWLADADVRDVPRPGDRIQAGSPVCTVFADGFHSADCHDALVRRAEWIYELLKSWECSQAHLP
jgi:predicted ATP-grasp superfamily ATP-dependent carboligase